VTRRYSEDVIPFLETVLNDDAKGKLWMNAVSTLGAIGTPKAREVLLKFLLKDPDAKLTEEQYFAKTDVPIALAWIVNKSGDVVALETLLSCTNGDWWQEQATKWSTIYSGEKQTHQLINSCIISLPLTGTKEAAVRLEFLRAAADEADDETAIRALDLSGFFGKFSGGADKVTELFTAVPASTAKAIDESGGVELIDAQLLELQKVNDLGLSGYYDD
jgi:hypothetical protein